MSAFRMDMGIGTDRTWKGDSELWTKLLIQMSWHDSLLKT